MSLIPVHLEGRAGVILIEAADDHDAVSRGASVVAEFDGLPFLCTACPAPPTGADGRPCFPEEATPSGRFLRLATQGDITKAASNRRLADEAKKGFDEGVSRLPRPPHAITVLLDLSRTRLQIGFKAERRFDATQVSERLHRRFGIEVEARQLSDREVAAATGSIGPCGRAVCCATWLQGVRELNVNLRTAKRQGLSLDPTRVNGCCGRYKCCIQFEAPSGPTPTTEPGKGTQA